MRYYIGIIHKDPDSDFGISFPDFPGCISAGGDLNEVMWMGREAIQAHIDLMVDEGEPIPEPSAMEQVMSDPDFQDGTPVLIPAEPPSSRTVRINVTLPEDQLREIDRYAEAHGFTRSGFLATAARKAIRDAA